MYTIFWLENQGRRRLGRPRQRGEDNIRIDLRETGRQVVDWLCLAQDRDQWQALVDTIKAFGLHKRWEIS
jgi:hypothetical protein